MYQGVVAEPDGFDFSVCGECGGHEDQLGRADPSLRTVDVCGGPVACDAATQGTRHVSMPFAGDDSTGIAALTADTALEHWIGSVFCTHCRRGCLLLAPKMGASFQESRPRIAVVPRQPRHHHRSAVSQESE